MLLPILMGDSDNCPQRAKVQMLLAPPGEGTGQRSQTDRMDYSNL